MKSSFFIFLSASFVLVSEVVVLTCLDNTSFHLHSPVRLASSFFTFVYLHTGSKINFLNFICKYFVFLSCRLTCHVTCLFHNNNSAAVT